jgi:hypothetical protein
MIIRVKKGRSALSAAEGAGIRWNRRKEMLARHHTLIIVAIAVALIVLALALAMEPGAAHGLLPW